MILLRDCRTANAWVETPVEALHTCAAVDSRSNQVDLKILLPSTTTYLLNKSDRHITMLLKAQHTDS